MAPPVKMRPSGVVATEHMVTLSLEHAYSGNGWSVSSSAASPFAPGLMQTPSSTICTATTCSRCKSHSMHRSSANFKEIHNGQGCIYSQLPWCSLPSGFWHMGTGVKRTSTVVQRTSTYCMASTKTPGLGLTRPTAQMACSSPLYSNGTSFLDRDHQSSHHACFDEQAGACTHSSQQ